MAGNVDGEAPTSPLSTMFKFADADQMGGIKDLMDGQSDGLSPPTSPIRVSRKSRERSEADRKSE